MASKPLCRMDPPPRSFAADAHDCIMAPILWIDRIQGCGAIPAPDGELPSDHVGLDRQIARRLTSMKGEPTN